MSQSNNDSSFLEYMTIDRHYTFTPTTFTKRQVRPSEYTLRNDGTVAKSHFERERLENERDALIFIAENSSIPVPRVLEWSDIDGVGSLTVERIRGDSFSVVYDTLEPSDQAKLERNTLSYVEETLVPQLQSLRSTKMGQLAGIVIPPVRVSCLDDRPQWEARTSTTSRYVYCHNDITTNNIIVDPVTLTVNAIVDWEYSGFFPKEMEFPFWKKSQEESLEEEHCYKMIELLDAPGEFRCKARIDLHRVLTRGVHR